MFKWAPFAVLVVGTAVLALVFRAMMPMPAPASSASGRIQQGTRVVMLGTGNPIADPKLPLEALRTIHSFDPCLACAIHTHDEDGAEISQVKVL